jgi:lipoprotein-anchoring transpeptidase ErfK/SrfK
MLLNIANTAISDDIDSHNRVWYEIGSQDSIEGYVYSGNIQPVKTLLSTPTLNLNIPIDGLLAEVSVPYTDAHEQADKTSKVAYRMYYETTHWIKSATANAQGQIWYQVYDDKWEKSYYARAEHIRVMTAEELAPISPEIPNKDKKVLVQLEQQLLTAYEKGAPVFVTPVSTGGIFRAGTYTTPKGAFITYYKRASRHMAAGDLASSGFDLPGVPWVQYITESGVSFHGTYWHNDFGRPRSHGCINLSTSAAKWLYRWTSPGVPIDKVFSYGSVGTNVEIIL